MKIVRVFVLFLALLILSWSSTFCNSSLKVTLETNKSIYTPSETVKIFGEVTLNASTVENAVVAVEVRDPASNPIISRTVETNSSGIYKVYFTLASDATCGNYMVYISCNYNGEQTLNSSSFTVEHIPSLALTVKTQNGTYKPGQVVTIFGSLTYDGSPVNNSLVAIEVQDPEQVPIAVRVLETDSQGNYRMTLKLNVGSKIGTYNVYAAASYEGIKATAYTSFKLETLSTDIDGNGVVNIVDISLVARAWGSTSGSPRWDPRCDIDGNGVVNIIDIALVAKDYGKTV